MHSFTRAVRGWIRYLLRVVLKLLCGMYTSLMTSVSSSLPLQVECKKAQPKEVMFPPGTRGRARGLPYTMDAFMLGMGMLSEYLSSVHRATPLVRHNMSMQSAWNPGQGDLCPGAVRGL